MKKLSIFVITMLLTFKSFSQNRDGYLIVETSKPVAFVFVKNDTLFITDTTLKKKDVTVLKYVQTFDAMYKLIECLNKDGSVYPRNRIKYNAALKNYLKLTQN